MTTRLRNPIDLDMPFTRAQFLATGGSRRTIDQRLARDLIRPILRGVYIATGLPDTLPMRARAVALVLPPGAAVSRATAAWLYGVDTRPPGSQAVVPAVECTVEPNVTPVRRPGLRCFSTHLDGDVVDVGGIPCTTPERTAADLLRWQLPFMGLGAVDAMTHAGIVTVNDVARTLEPLTGHRYVARARQLLSWCEPLTESFGESWLRLRLLEAGFPRPQAQVWIADLDGVGRGEVLGTSPRLELGVGELLCMTPRLPRRPW